MEINYIIFGLSFFTIIISIAAGILYVLYLPFKIWLLRSGRLTKDNSRLINRIYIAIMIAAILFSSYSFVYPDEGFYKSEFEAVTLKDFPNSAEFVEKHASPPDFHGDYCSASQIKLSEEHYKILLEQILADKAIVPDPQITYSNEFEGALEKKSADKIVHHFSRSTKSDKFLSIGFYDDKKTIFIHVCKT